MWGMLQVSSQELHHHSIVSTAGQINAMCVCVRSSSVHCLSAGEFVCRRFKSPQTKHFHMMGMHLGEKKNVLQEEVQEEV